MFKFRIRPAGGETIIALTYQDAKTAYKEAMRLCRTFIRQDRVHNESRVYTFRVYGVNEENRLRMTCGRRVYVGQDGFYFMH